jgi:monovalent cation/proton antiporter MnhG/PhaG subunit
MIEIAVGILLLFSSVIVLIASIGIIRFNDIYARMHVVTKVSSFGLILLLIAVNLYFQKPWILIQSIILFHVIIFLSPISAHVISKISRLLKNEENDNSISPNDESKKELPL